MANQFAVPMGELTKIVKAGDLSDDEAIDAVGKVVTRGEKLLCVGAGIVNGTICLRVVFKRSGWNRVGGRRIVDADGKPPYERWKRPTWRDRPPML